MIRILSFAFQKAISLPQAIASRVLFVIFAEQFQVTAWTNRS